MIEQLKTLLNKLSLKQKLSIGAAVVAMAGSLFYLTHWTKERDFRPLFTSLTAEDAGAIVQKLKESGVEYRVVQDGTAIVVPSGKISELRLELASAGIPKSGRIGFELFDKTQLGLTDFSEHVNYRRALEGELERSIRELAEVEQARVHLTFPKDSVFVEERQPGKASVLIKLRTGQKMKPGSASAICHLVASAVDGLQPEAVALLDVNGNLLNRPRRAGSAVDEGMAETEATLEYRRHIEKDLLQKINMTLEPLLGPDRFRASVSVECDFSSGEQSEEIFDPEKSVMLTSQKTEDSSTPNAGQAAAAGVPGTASTLPRAVTKTASGGPATSRRTENVQYQTSRLVKRVTIPRGSVRKVSAAILIDHHVKTVTSGKNTSRQIVPPSAEELRGIRQLLTGIVGFNGERGDQLIVEALPFEATVQSQPDAFSGDPGASHPESNDWLRRLREDRVVQMAVGGALLCGIGLIVLVVMMLRRLKKKRNKKNAPAAELVAQPALEAAAGETELIAAAAEKQLTAPTVKIDSLLGEITSSLKNDPAMCAQVLRVWLQEGKA